MLVGAKRVIKKVLVCGGKKLNEANCVNKKVPVYGEKMRGKKYEFRISYKKE